METCSLDAALVFATVCNRLQPSGNDRGEKESTNDLFIVPIVLIPISFCISVSIGDASNPQSMHNCNTCGKSTLSQLSFFIGETIRCDLQDVLPPILSTVAILMTLMHLLRVEVLSENDGTSTTDGPILTGSFSLGSLDQANG